jgi:phosphatidate cytidylyltransferase
MNNKEIKSPQVNENNPELNQSNNTKHKFHTIEINKITEKTKKSFRIRTITAIVLLLLCVPCLVLGEFSFFASILVILVAATYEFVHVLRKKKYPKFVNIFTYLMTISLAFWPYFKSLYLAIYHNANVKTAVFSYGYNFLTTNIEISTIGIAILILVLYLFSILYDDFTVGDVGYLSGTSLLLILGIQSFFFLRYSPMSVQVSGAYFNYGGSIYCSALLFTYVVIGTFGTDIGAYAFGILFGKNKINPRISPNKTWAGFWGGILSSSILSMIFGLVIVFNNIPLLYGVLDSSHWYLIVFFSILMPFVSTLGDFIFSAIKRYYDIKDFGNVLPGHGGVLDRVDSLLVTSIVVALFILTYVLYFNGGVFIF